MSSQTTACSVSPCSTSSLEVRVTNLHLPLEAEPLFGIQSCAVIIVAVPWLHPEPQLHVVCSGDVVHMELRVLGERVTQVQSLLGARIGTEEALYLYTSGPDLTSIMPCKYGKSSGIFTKFVTEDALRSEHVRDLFLKNTDLDTAALVVSMRLSWTVMF